MVINGGMVCCQYPTRMHTKLCLRVSVGQAIKEILLSMTLKSKTKHARLQLIVTLRIQYLSCNFVAGSIDLVIILIGVVDRVEPHQSTQDQLLITPLAIKEVLIYICTECVKVQSEVLVQKQFWIYYRERRQNKKSQFGFLKLILLLFTPLY